MKFRCLCIFIILFLFLGVSNSFKQFSLFSRVPENDNKRPAVTVSDEIDGIQSLSSCISYGKLDYTEIFFNKLTNKCVISKSEGLSQMIVSSGYIHMSTTAESSTDWRMHGKSQYWPVYSGKTWINAQKECLKYGSKLTEIETVEEYDFVKSIAEEIDAANIHIGGTDAFEEGNMVWWSSLLSENLGPGLWTRNQPDNYDNNEHCLNLQRTSDYKLNDSNCQSVFPFICERSV
ncbi:lectin-like [Saccostrea cucullata]|uniref:lectin-like n=1 Tax=Saccostrea cuccullata TaxID=36930 RepID=UPI002ED36CD7